MTPRDGSTIRSGSWDGKSDQGSGSDGANLIGSIKKTDSGCSRQDRTPLSTSASTPNARPRSPSRRTERLPCPDSPGTAANALRSPKAARTLSVVALAVLVGLTSWAIASVSSGLVGVYASVMVLIFALPRADRPEAAAVKSDDDRQRDRSKRPGEPEVRRRVRRDSSDCAVPVDRTGHDEPDSENAPSASAATPRRTRARARKVAKPGVEPLPEPPVASWLQVGPGKFVRSDTQPAPTTVVPEPHSPIEPAADPREETEVERVGTEETASVPSATNDEAAPIDLNLDSETETPPAEERLSSPISAARGYAASGPSNVTWVRLRRAALPILGSGRRGNPSHGLRNVSSSPIRSGSVDSRLGACARWRTYCSRNSERSSRPQRSFLPRSPPRRC
jgi:hypothetical protein